MRKILWPFFFYLSCFAQNPGSISLINDSPFILVVVIQSADGRPIAQKTLRPGEQTSSVTNLDPTELDLPGVSGGSYTPYSVVWKCSNGGFYSVCSNVSPGALIRATDCAGSYYCKPKEKEKEEKCCKPCPEKDQK